MRILGVTLALLSTLWSAALAQDASPQPQRVVSLNMCTDQLVLALADSEQIVALSRFAGDVRLSFAAVDAAPYLHLPAAAEAVLRLEPDLVVTGRFTNAATKAMLVRFGERVEEIPFVRSLEEAYAVITMMAAWLGHPERGAALIEQIKTAIDEAHADTDLTTLLVQRRGYTTGSASLTGDLLAELGLTLASDGLVGARGGFVDLESLVRADPDFLIMADLAPLAEDQGTALLNHPALAARFPASRRLALPERLTVCPGPSLIEAARHIARQRDRLLQNADG